MDTAARAKVHTFLNTENHIDVEGANNSMHTRTAMIIATKMRLQMERLYFSHITATSLDFLCCLLTKDTGGFNNKNDD